MSFIKSQLFVKLPVPEQSYKDKVTIVTGSNTGLGQEAARHLARLGASKVILAVRSIEKGEKAKASIEASTKCEPSVVEVWPLDLGSYASVEKFAERCNELERLDAVIENAGVASWKFSKAEEYETTITVNVISTFLLAYLLLPKLKETASKFSTRPNLTIVSSEVHTWAKFEERNIANKQNKAFLDVLSDENTAVMKDRYNVSKLLEVIMVREMAARAERDSYPVTINCLNPGFCLSELRREASKIQNMLFRGMEMALARTQEEGSRTLVHAAGAGKETHGEYLSDCKVAQVGKLVSNPDEKANKEKVYEEITKKLDAIHPGVTANL